MILSPYFPEFKEINALRAQAGYGFKKMNVPVHLPKALTAFQPVAKTVVRHKRKSHIVSG
jgi:hypothetical protein